MDKPKFFLNPNAAPFIPKLKKASEGGFEIENMDPIVMFHDSATHEETVVHEAFNPAWQLSTDVSENLLIFDEDSEWRDYQILDPEDQVPQYDTMGIGKQDLEDGSQIAQEDTMTSLKAFPMICIPVGLQAPVVIMTHYLMRFLH